MQTTKIENLTHALNVIIARYLQSDVTQALTDLHETKGLLDEALAERDAS